MATPCWRSRTSAVPLEKRRGSGQPEREGGGHDKFGSFGSGGIALSPLYWTEEVNAMIVAPYPVCGGFVVEWELGVHDVEEATIDLTDGTIPGQLEVSDPGRSDQTRVEMGLRAEVRE